MTYPFRYATLKYHVHRIYIVGRSEGWPRPSTPLVFAVGTWMNAL